jgi:hypothetical protein
MYIKKKIFLIPYSLLLIPFIFSACSHKTTPDDFEFTDNAGDNIGLFSTCGGFECFKEEFSKCARGASLTSNVIPELKYQYEILGPKRDGCEVRSYFITHTAGWEGKQMVCTYDMTQDFSIAAQNKTTCKGELCDLMDDCPEAVRQE